MIDVSINSIRKTSKTGDSRLRETNQKILTDEGVMIKGLYYIGEVNPVCALVDLFI
jgi:hypothetical protein